jgi:hypothetical protein
MQSLQEEEVALFMDQIHATNFQGLFDTYTLMARKSDKSNKLESSGIEDIEYDLGESILTEKETSLGWYLQTTLSSPLNMTLGGTEAKINSIVAYKRGRNIGFGRVLDINEEELEVQNFKRIGQTNKYNLIEEEENTEKQNVICSNVEMVIRCNSKGNEEVYIWNTVLDYEEFKGIAFPRTEHFLGTPLLLNPRFSNQYSSKKASIGGDAFLQLIGGYI